MAADKASKQRIEASLSGALSERLVDGLCVVGFASHMILQPLLFWQSSVRGSSLEPDTFANALVASSGNIAYPLAIVVLGVLFFALGKRSATPPARVQLAFMLCFFAGGAICDALPFLVESPTTLVAPSLGGVLIGCGCAFGIVLWQQVLYTRGSVKSAIINALGAIIAGSLYFALNLPPRSITLLLGFLLFLPLSGITLAYLTRSYPLDKLHLKSEQMKPFVEALRLSRSLLACVGGISFAWGLFYAFSINFTANDSLRDLFSFGRIVVGVIAIFVVFRTGRCPSVDGLVKVSLPLSLTVSLLLPFTPSDYLFGLAGVLYTVFGLFSLSLMIEANEAARRCRIHPVLSYCAILGFFYIVQIVGFLAGQTATLWIGSETVFSVTWKLAIALIAVYALSVAGFVHFSRKKGAALGTGESHAGNGGSRDMTNDETVCALFDKYAFTDREREVATLLLKGRSVPHIGSALHLSSNTIRYHMKNLYQKTNVHSRQEFIDIFENDSVTEP